MNIIVAGAGAIGGTVAVLLKDAGYDVSIMCHSVASKEKIEKEGFFLNGAKGDYYEHFDCYCSAEDLGDKKFDIVIIATKYAHMAECAKTMLPYVAENGLVVGMQNGLLTEELGEIVGRDKVVGCMIGFGATRNKVNQVTMTSLGEFWHIAVPLILPFYATMAMLSVTGILDAGGAALLLTGGAYGTYDISFYLYKYTVSGTLNDQGIAGAVGLIKGAIVLPVALIINRLVNKVETVEY